MAGCPSATLLLLLLAVSCSPLALACGSCPKSPKSSPPKSPKSPESPITLPPVMPLPKLPIPNVPLPSLPLPPVTMPPLPVPPVTMPPLPVPPVTMPPVTIPVIGGGGTPASPKGKKHRRGCPPPPPKTCPIDTLKIGACLDILGSTVKVGDPAVSCCEPLAGIAGLDAALCLCTTIKAKLLDINIVLPLALQVLVNTCGKSIPPGYTCP